MSESSRDIKPTDAVRKASGRASVLPIIYLLTATVASCAAWALDRLLWNTAGIAIDAQLYGILASILPTICGAAAAIIAARKLIGFPVKEILARPYLRPGVILLGFGLCMGINSITSFLTELLTQWLNQGGVPVTPPDFSYSSERPLLSGVLIFYACLIAPVLEEIIFRGYILRLLQRFGGSFAILLSALLFSFYHFDLTQLLPTFAMGCLFGYLAIQCGSIIPVIGVHILNNAVAVLLRTFSQTFSPTVLLAINLALYVLAFLSLIAALYLYRKSRHKPRGADLEGRIATAKALGAAVTSPMWILLTIVYLYQVVSRIVTF